jgi:hypothetical protein
MTGKTDRSMRKFLDSLPGRFLMVLLITLGMALIIVWIVQVNASIPSVILKWAVIAWIGIVSGLVTCFLLGKTPFALRFLAATSAIILGLSFIGLVTRGEFGVNPLGGIIAGNEWVWLSQLIIGGLFSMLVFWAWRFVPQQEQAISKSFKNKKQTSQKTSSKSRNHSVVKPGKTSPSKGTSSRKIVKSGSLKVSQKNSAANTTRKNVKKKTGSGSSKLGKKTGTRKKVTVAGSDSGKKTSTQKKTVASGSRKSTSAAKRKPASREIPNKAKERQFWVSQWAQLQTKTRDFWKNGQAAQMQIRNRLTQKVSKPKTRIINRRTRTVTTRRRRQNDAIRLVGVVEHRCPYCLELVEDNDVRGVRVCSTCHTRHHADCWAETGVCQVPHYHD